MMDYPVSEASLVKACTALYGDDGKVDEYRQTVRGAFNQLVATGKNETAAREVVQAQYIDEVVEGERQRRAHEDRLATITPIPVPDDPDEYDAILEQGMREMNGDGECETEEEFQIRYKNFF
ncbi:hypothetical protein NQ011_11245 [Corynebacterium phoceense]|uniref:hypothetical protein n=1 Tax=Corynebacterium phoceense TaxID=1686286 RepID=UPI00211CE1DE|nr:hypothetical protein [Corynebacterium phoceense]MCQ9337245.1 hypothetical protein [Corynebacterium phoceense]